MDLYCPTCGEPWDFDTLHEEAQERYGISFYEEPDVRGYYYGSPHFTKIKNEDYDEQEYRKVYEQVSQEFRQKGCKALTHLTDATDCKPRTIPEDSPERDRTFNLTCEEAAGALYDILGDDMDGAAAMLKDMGF